jgi:hypothetical protein
MSSAAYPVASLANIAASQNQLDRAIRLHAAASGLRVKHGTPISPDGLEKIHDDISKIRARMDEREYMLSWKLGTAMTVPELVAYCQAVPANAPAPQIVSAEFEILV